MSWDFSTDSEFQDVLDWMDDFVTREVEPLDLIYKGPGDPWDPRSPARAAMKPLQARVKDQGLWACHLGPELGGQGFGQLKLALMNEVLGRSRFAPSVFGCQAPDTGNAEILARYGTQGQKARFLQPLLDGEIASCFSMTEPQAGADPSEFVCRGTRTEDGWRLDGEKWFASHASFSEFLIVMAVTDPEVPIHQGASMFLVERDTPGLEVLRDVMVGPAPELGSGVHGYLKFSNCRIPPENLLGEEGKGFEVAQSRLGGGRVHHAMRTVAVLKKCLDMMCERALSRRTRGQLLGDLQLTQQKVADAYTRITQFRLHVLYAAWLLDRDGGYTRPVRREISAIKAAMPGVLQDVVYPTLHLHGSLGMSNETPLMNFWQMVPEMGIVDGPTEVHQVAVAKSILRERAGHEGTFPSYHVPERTAAARAKLGLPE